MRIKAAILEDGQIKLGEAEFVLPSGAVELEVLACGICGSDLRYLAGEDAWAAHTLGQRRQLPRRMVLGHEIVGRPVGENRPAAVIPFFTCRVCWWCRTGRPELCPNTIHHGHGEGSEPEKLSFGGFAERTAAYPDQLLALPDEMDPIHATLLDPVAVAVHAWSRVQVPPSSVFMVIGAGPIGLCIMQVGMALGHGPPVVVEISKPAAQRAERLGAVSVNAAEMSPDEIAGFVRRITSVGVEAIFDTTASPDAFRLGLSCLAPDGVFTLVAGAPGHARFSAAEMAGQRRLQTVCNARYEDYVTALKMLALDAVDAEQMITHVFGLEEIEQAFEVAQNKADHDACKVVVAVQ